MSISTKVFRLLNLNTKYRFPLHIQECQYKRSLRPVMVEFKKRQARADFKAVIPKLPNHRSTYLEWNYDSEIYAFGKRLKEEFDPQLLRTAFTHRSYIIQQEMKQRDLGIENPDIKLQDNRELIEEGETFMREYIVTFLEVALPKFPLEGILAIRDHLMKTEVLADVASHLGCKDIILSQEYPVTEEILSNTFKAIVSALIQSSDTARAGNFVRDFVITTLHHQDINELWTVERPMELLQELMKKGGMNEPELRLISESAKNTILACYRVGIYVDKNLFCDSFGESVPIAKEMAAREGLKVFFGTPDNMAPINYRLQVLPKQRTSRTKSVQAY